MLAMIHFRREWLHKAHTNFMNTITYSYKIPLPVYTVLVSINYAEHSTARPHVYDYDYLSDDERIEDIHYMTIPCFKLSGTAPPRTPYLRSNTPLLSRR